MALTPQQIEAIKEAKSLGLSKEAALARAFSSKMNTPQRPRGRFSGSELMEDVKTTGTDLIQGLGTRYADVTSAVSSDNMISRYRKYGGGVKGFAGAVGELGLTAGGNLIGAGFDVASAPVMGAARLAASPQEEQKVASLFEKGLNATGIPQAIDKMSPEGQRNTRAAFGALDGIGLGIASKVTNPLTNMFRRNDPVKAVDQVFKDTEIGLQKAAEDPTLSPRAREEAARSALSLKERYIGMTPAEKKRLGEMGPEKLQEYLDAVHRVNIDDTMPTPYEVGGDNARLVQDELDELLADTGSSIGQTRQKLSTYKANPTQVQSIESSFTRELSRLKLEVRNGKVVQTKGTISGVTSGDITVLNDLYQDLKTFKQSPTLTNMVDLRMNFDGKVNFNKAFRDVSGNVDPLSRSVRKTIANEAERLVGKTEAKELAKYSDFMDAYGDLKSYTKRNAGGEYLLRQVLSGRGGEARKLIQTIKEYTGKDLMNDATAMKMATDLLGNDNTKNLFRQEITNAGYDAATVLSGSPTGIAAIGIKKLLEIGIDPEDVLKAAAAGTGGYLLYTYMEPEGLLAPAGVAVLAAMPQKARLEAIDQALEINAMKRAQAAEGSATAIQLDKANKELVRLKELPEEGFNAELEALDKFDKTPSKKPQSVTTKTTDLLEEAKKYDSADEFFEDKANYWRTGELTGKDVGVGGLFFGKDKGVVKELAGGDVSTVKQYVIQLPPEDQIYRAGSQVDTAIDVLPEGRLKKYINYQFNDVIPDEFYSATEAQKYMEKYDSELARKGFDTFTATGKRDFAMMLDTKIKKALEKRGIKMVVYNSPDDFNFFAEGGSVEDVIVYDKNLIKTKSDIEDIWKQANTKGTDLLEEAKKYDSADEFVKAQGEPVYHATDSAEFNPADFDTSKSVKADDLFFNPLGDGMYVSSNQDFVRKFGSNRVEMYLDPKAKIKEVTIDSWEEGFDELLNNILEDLDISFSDLTQTERGYINRLVPDTPINSMNQLEDILQDAADRKGITKSVQKTIQEVVDADNEGFDAVRYMDTDYYTEADETVIKNRDMLKTRSQLEDIWKQANE